MEQMMQQMQEQPEEAGRGTDTVMAHMTLGEVVIPRSFMQDPNFAQMIAEYYQQQGEDIAEFTVGDQANKINPETGYPEFFKFGKLLKTVAPLALSYFAPGLGTAIGSGILGAGAAGASTLGSGLLGAGLGLATGGGIKGAITGGVLGGIGANIGSLGGGVAQGPSAIGQVRPTGYGSGILGQIGSATGITSNSLPSLSGLTGGGGGGSSFSGQGLSSALGGYAQNDAIKKAQQAQLAAQQQQLGNLDTFDPSNITNDAGYQFNLAEGQKGLDRSAAAQGGLQSGKALKAAAQYNQQYADNALNSAYQRWSDKTGAQNSIYGNIGNVKAQSGLAGAQNIASTASGILNPQPSIEDLLRLYGRA